MSSLALANRELSRETFLVNEEERELKDWLTSLFPKDMSRREVGDELHVDRKTISALISPTNPSFGQGRTLLGYLRLVGALRDDVPAAGPQTSRLAALEAVVEKQGEEMTAALYELAAEVRALKRGRDGKDPPARQAQVDR